MKIVFTLVALLATTQAFSAETETTTWPGGLPQYSQCFPFVATEYFFTHGYFASLWLAIKNQEACKAERLKVTGY